MATTTTPSALPSCPARRWRCPLIDFKPDIIHCNDWQTALVPVYYSLFYAGNEWFEGIKTVFTIHNIQYQGKYGDEILEDVLGIPSSQRQLLEFDGCINLMKGAIEAANAVTTVSPTYAGEILDPWYSHGLDPILRARGWKVSGILNGIDVGSYDPETDPDIFLNYSAENPAGKAEKQTRPAGAAGSGTAPGRADDRHGDPYGRPQGTRSRQGGLL